MMSKERGVLGSNPFKVTFTENHRLRFWLLHSKQSRHVYLILSASNAHPYLAQPWLFQDLSTPLYPLPFPFLPHFTIMEIQQVERYFFLVPSGLNLT